MENIAKEIQEKQAERKLNILKGFSEFEETFEKAKTGKYADNSTNRKLNRVGQQYGNSKKEEEKSNDKTSKKEDGKSDPSGHYTKDERDALNKLEEHASSTSTEDLKAFLKKYGNDSTKIDEIEAARIELEDRGENLDNEDDNESDKKSSVTEKISHEQHMLLAEAMGDGSDYKDADEFLEQLKDGEVAMGSTDFEDLSDETIKDWFDENLAAKKELELESKLEKVTKSVENLKKHLTSKE